MSGRSDPQLPSTTPAADLVAPAEVAKPLVPRDTKTDMVDYANKASARPLSEPTKEQQSVAADVHGYMRGFIASADQKAAFFFAATAALLAFLHSNKAAVRWIKSPVGWSYLDGLACVATIGLLLSALVLFVAVFPRLGGDQRGILFFRAIAKYPSGAEYADDVLGRSDKDLVRVRLQHTYDLAKVCAAKFLLLKVAFWVGGVGFVAALTFLALA